MASCGVRIFIPGLASIIQKLLTICNILLDFHSQKQHDQAQLEDIACIINGLVMTGEMHMKDTSYGKVSLTRTWKNRALPKLCSVLALTISESHILHESSFEGKDA